MAAKAGSEDVPHAPVAAKEPFNKLLGRCLQKLGVAAALVVLLSGATTIDANSPSWKLHQKKAEDFVKAKKFDDALDEFTAAYLDLKDEQLESSQNAMQLYIDYKHALRSAGMDAEADALASALIRLQPKIFSLANQKTESGIRQLNASDFQNAIENLEEAMRLNPANKTAQQNLSIAYNNYGLQKAAQSPKASMQFFRKAILLDPNNKVSRDNLAGVWRMAGKNPAIFAERVTTGDALLKENDCIGAFVEYSEALRIKPDAAVQAKLKAIPAIDPLYVALKLKEVQTAETVSQKTEHKISEQDRMLADSLEIGIAKAHAYFEKKEKLLAANSFLKQASEDKARAITLIARLNGIADSARIQDSFNKAVVALGKDPNSESDLLELAEEGRTAKNYEVSVFVLKQIDIPGPQTEKDLRSSYALLIAQQLGKVTDPVAEAPSNSGHEELSDLLAAEFPVKDPGTTGSAIPLPPSIDLSAFVEGAPAKPLPEEPSPSATPSNDGPAQALQGMSMLHASNRSAKGYRILVGSLNKDWPADANRVRAAVHVVICRLLQRDAEEAKKSVDSKTRVFEDLQRISVQFRQAVLCDPKNAEAVDGFFGIAQEAVRINNNANNQLMLAGAYLLKGNRTAAEACYARALTQKPYDPVVRQAYDRFKNSVK